MGTLSGNAGQTGDEMNEWSWDDNRRLRVAAKIALTEYVHGPAMFGDEKTRYKLGEALIAALFHWPKMGTYKHFAFDHDGYERDHQVNNALRMLAGPHCVTVFLVLWRQKHDT